MQTLEEIQSLLPSMLFKRAMTTPAFLNGHCNTVSKREWRRWLRKNSRIQLAWIGDRILDRVVRRVAKVHTIDGNLVVSAKHLFTVGENIGIFSRLLCSNGERTQYWKRCRVNNRRKGHQPMPRLIAESVEALIAVIYLTHGYQRAADFIQDAVIPRVC